METKDYQIINEQTIQKRYNEFMKQAEELYPNLNNITILEYRNLREDFLKGDRNALILLFEKSIKDILVCVAKIYSKNEIEGYVPFQEAASYALWHMRNMIANFETLPKYKAHFTESLMAVYLYKKLIQQYEDAIRDQSRYEFMPTSNLAWQVDNQKAEDFDYNTVVSEEFKNAVRKLLKNFNETDQKVLTLRFGLENDEPMTLKEIAETYGVTRSRVDQVVRRVVKKLEKNAILKNRFQKCYDMYLTEN